MEKKNNEKEREKDNEGHIYEKIIGENFSKILHADYNTGFKYDFYNILINYHAPKYKSLSEIKIQKQALYNEIINNYEKEKSKIKDLLQDIYISDTGSSSTNKDDSLEMSTFDNKEKKRKIQIKGDFDVILPYVDIKRFNYLININKKYIREINSYKNLKEKINIFIETGIDILEHKNKKYIQIIKYNSVLEKIIKIYEDLYLEANKNTSNKELKEEQFKSHVITIYKNIKNKSIELLDNGNMIIYGIDINSVQSIEKQFELNNKLGLILKFINTYKLYKYENSTFYCTLDYCLFLITNKSYYKFIVKYYKNEEESNFQSIAQLNFIKNIDKIVKKFEEDEKFGFKPKSKEIKGKIKNDEQSSENIRNSNITDNILNYIGNNLRCKVYFMYVHYELSINEFMNISLFYLKEQEQVKKKELNDDELFKKFMEEKQKKIFDDNQINIENKLKEYDKKNQENKKTFENKIKKYEDKIKEYEKEIKEYKNEIKEYGEKIKKYETKQENEIQKLILYIIIFLIIIIILLKK